MSETKVCTCTDKRTCDPCAERDFALLVARTKADPKWIAEEEAGKLIIIDPRPEAREARSGFHRLGERGKKVDIERHDEDAEDVETEMKRISAKVRAAKPASYSEGEVAWCCPSCKWLPKDAQPLADGDGLHCPNDGCDSVVALLPR